MGYEEIDGFWATDWLGAGNGREGILASATHYGVTGAEDDEQIDTIIEKMQDDAERECPGTVLIGLRAGVQAMIDEVLEEVEDHG